MKTMISGVKLNMDYSTVGAIGTQNYTNFVSTFLNDVSKSIYIPISRLQIESVTSGSVIVAFSILPGTPISEVLATAFINSLNSPGSLLFTGTVTSTINSSVTPIVTTVAMSPISTGPSGTVYVNPATGGQPGVTGSTGSTGSTGTNGSANASLYELRDLVVRISAEIIRLQASGTTDPIVTQRVKVLSSVESAVIDIIRYVETGQIKESDIPILKSDYTAFLPVMSNMNTPLPNLISNAGISSTLNSLFPLYMGGDISGASLAKSLFDKYAGGLMKNLSWSLNLSHKSEAELRIAQEMARGLSGGSVDNTNSMGPYAAAPPTAYRGMFDSVIKNKMNQTTHTGSTGSTGSSGPIHQANMGGPIKLDWKKRSQQICDMIDRRGLKSSDFGCMKNTDSVSSNFSFRGYAKMICARLATNYDPGIPELCGCPPPTWAGWRS
jgi:hypothetical protein